jgi:hypothetical protein
MLFDLTGRGRRRTVRIVYTGLALLFAVSFVGLGVGTSGGGGFIEALFGGKGSSVNSTNYSAQLKAARKLTETQPNSAAAWSGLIHTVLLQAATEGNYVSDAATGAEGFTSNAHALLVEAQEAWRHYLKLDPHHPSADVAREAIRVYTTPGGLSDPQAALQAMQVIVAASPPAAGLYSQLAVYAYQAKDDKLGDAVSKKALALAPGGERTVLENYLSKAKSSANGSAESSAAGGAKTVTIPASKGATGGKTVTIPTSSLPKGTVTTPAKK